MARGEGRWRQAGATHHHHSARASWPRDAGAAAVTAAITAAAATIAVAGAAQPVRGLHEGEPRGVLGRQPVCTRSAPHTTRHASPHGKAGTGAAGRAPLRVCIGGVGGVAR